jgi:putative FmdB family regulatory protein
MPTYSYHCDTCGHDFDAVQRFADEPLKECPQCGAAIRRVIQPVGVVFKGSGWYITDSRKGSSEGSESSSRAKSSSEFSEKAGAATAKADSPDGAKPEKAAAKVAD